MTRAPPTGGTETTIPTLDPPWSRPPRSWTPSQFINPTYPASNSVNHSNFVTVKTLRLKATWMVSLTEENPCSAQRACLWVQVKGAYLYTEDKGEDGWAINLWTKVMSGLWREQTGGPTVVIQRWQLLRPMRQWLWSLLMCVQSVHWFCSIATVGWSAIPIFLNFNIC